MSFLCGFGKKSKKEEPYSKHSINGGGKTTRDEVPKERPRGRGQPDQPPRHDRPKGQKAGSKVTDVNQNPNLNRPPDKVIMTSSKQKQSTTTDDLQHGGQGVPSPVTHKEKQQGEDRKSEAVDGNSNQLEAKTGSDRGVVIQSFQEAQDIEKLTEHIMSGEKITSVDIVGRKPNMEQPVEDRLGSQAYYPIQPLPTEDVSRPPKMKSVPKVEPAKEYITADQMVADDSYMHYKMNHKARGKCVIVNVGEFHPSTRMQNRNGYLVDGELMKGTFTRLGFNVTYLKNPKSIEMKRMLEQVSLADHTNSDCFAMVIMTHGNRDYGDIIFTRDGIMHLDFIIEYFNGQNCPQLAGKPKLFFVQACRGDKLDQGQELAFIDDDVDEMDAAPTATRIPIEADILLSQATTPGYISFRNNQNGSVYIRCLTKAFGEHGFSEDILSILTRVNAMVAFEFESNSRSRPEFHGKKQMPAFTCQLTKKLKFMPPKVKNG